MKITKRQLRRIVKEEMAHQRDNLGAMIAVGGGSDADRAAALGMTLEEYLSYS